MSSLSCPLPHSCNYCAKLSLDCKENIEQMWNEARCASADYSEIDKGTRSQRIRAWYNSFAGVELRDQKIVNMENIMIFDITLPAAREAAEEGCSFCSLLLKTVESLTKSAQRDFVLFAAEIEDDSIRFGFPELNAMSSTFESKESLGSYIQVSHEDSFDITVVAENAAAKYFRTRPINNNPGSLSSLNLAKSWLQTCLKDHQECQKPSSNFIPTRLIEIVHVNTRSCLRLIETNWTTQGPYAVLSYCWGKENHVITSKASIRRHLLRINKQDLPKTLQDAVLLTESLGLKYLWVDALCIVQDDDNDKAWEIAQMPLVYGQATVTITASRASDVQEGFLHVRDHPNADHPELQLPYRCPSGELGSVIISPPLNEPTEPLDRRAWALQERFMSSRILDYGSIHTRWICPGTGDYKSITDGFTDNSAYNDDRSDSTFSTARKLVLANAIGPALEDKSLRDLYNQWESLLRIYTHRTLTRPTDRLLAFSGIAARFAKILKDDYVAGLWSSRLLVGELLWTVDAVSSYDEALLPRQSEYQGPSWSWAGVNSPVRFWHQSGRLHEKFKVIKYHVQLSGKGRMLDVDPPKYGAVVSGILEVQGLLRPAKWAFDLEKWNEHQGSVLKIHNLDGLDEVLAARVYADAIEEEFISGGSEFLAVSLLVVKATHDSSPEGLEGLVLRRKNKSEYLRVGVFDIHEGYTPLEHEQNTDLQEQRLRRQIQWFHDDDPQIITIV